ncbi:MAG: folate-binding protein, partial [Actinobacteria bacterium]|nr:folate-binding protein [Actinomycetota bacterium]
MSSLDLPQAVAGPAGTVDESIAWHFGDPHREQRLLVEGISIVDISNRGVVTVTGPDRLTWLHTLTTQHLENLQPNESA